VIAIDIPIGLLDKPQSGGRECDQLARKLLGRRASSVFTPTTRSLLHATRYTQVRKFGLSIQSFNILPKVREVDQLMTPALQQRVYEAHPELAFMSVAGAPMQYNKKTQEGREERQKILESLFHQKGKKSPFTSPFFKGGTRKAQGDFHQHFPRSQAAPDDLLDAYVLAWTALCINNSQADRVPPHPLLDAKGLRMEIWY
jgi:predicted RNase H-like nuclease